MNTHCRIKNVKMKDGSASIHLLPEPSDENIYSFVSNDGNVVISSSEKSLTNERALFLLEETKLQIMGFK